MKWIVLILAVIVALVVVVVSIGDGTSLTITEEGEVYDPVFRFASRFIIGHTRTIDRYLNDLKQRFGESSK